MYSKHIIFFQLYNIFKRRVQAVGLTFNVCCMFPSQLSDVMVKEICEGVDGTTMRCGTIGEIGVSWPRLALRRSL